MLCERRPAVVGLRDDSGPHAGRIFNWSGRRTGTPAGPPRGLREPDRKEHSVPTLALILVLIAALAHAGWNLLAKTASGGAAFVWLGTVAGTVIWIPALVVALLVAPGELGAEGVGLMIGSGALHAIYFVLLQRGYRHGDLSLVYPLARGTGPLLATLAAIAFLDERPTALALAGAAVIVAAVLSLTRGAGGPDRPEVREAIVFALLTGVSIAVYTLWDKRAVGTVDLSPIVYFWGTQVVIALVLSPYVLSRPDRLAATWRDSRAQALGLAVLAPLAYVLVLFALARAPVSYVAPAREVSILVAAALGATLLSEGDVGRRAAAAVAIVLGIVALALG
jgi:drug/metabolite transporter (DMT)-like permease